MHVAKLHKLKYQRLSVYMHVLTGLHPGNSNERKILKGYVEISHTICILKVYCHKSHSSYDIPGCSGVRCLCITRTQLSVSW